jgi:hypothetical protein
MTWAKANSHVNQITRRDLTRQRSGRSELEVWRLTPKFSRMRRRRNSPPRQTLAPHVGCNATLGAAAKMLPACVFDSSATLELWFSCAIVPESLVSTERAATGLEGSSSGPPPSGHLPRSWSKPNETTAAAVVSCGTQFPAKMPGMRTAAQ